MYLTTKILAAIAALFFTINIVAAANNHPVTSIQLSTEQVSAADLKNTDTSYSYDELSIRWEWQVLLFNIKQQQYQWRDTTAFDGGAGNAPWQSLTQIAPGFQYYSKIGEQWGVWGKVMAIAGFEGNISSQAWSYNPQLISFFKASPQKIYYGGAGLLYHPIESLYYPILGVAWNLESRKGLSFALGFPETMLRYGFSKQLAVKIDFAIDVRIYNLASDSSVAPDGFLRIAEMIPGIRLEYKLTKKTLLLHAGMRGHAGRLLTLYNKKENQQAIYNVDLSWAMHMGLEYRF